MSWGWYDDSDYDYEYEEIEPTADAIIIKGPVSARSRRGAIGETWWGEQWVAAMMRLGDARLDRGKTYARNGRVKGLTIQHGMAFAKVQGTYPKPYQSSFALQTFKPGEWNKALDALAEQAIYAARLLAGEMPEDIEGVFNEVGLSLFPRSRDDIGFDCSCPDWGDPCKHCAAIYYLVAEQLDVDPFILFHLRGYTREQVLDGLRKRRGSSPAPEVDTGQVDQPTAPSLDADLATFWQPSADFPAAEIPSTPSHPPMIARLGSPPDRIESELKGIYQIVSERAMNWPEAGNGNGDDEDLPPLDEALAYFLEPESDISPWRLDSQDIALLPDRDRRFEGILVDAFGMEEELVSIEIYLHDGLCFPFDALWRDPDEPGHEEPVAVLGVYNIDDRRGVLLNVMRGKKKRRVEADQLWAVDAGSPEATILDDYRYWIYQLHGLTPDDEGW